MSLTTDPPGPPWKQPAAEVAAWLANAPRGALLELMARIGFVARGVLYVSVGTLALLAVFDVTPRASGPFDAMAAWGRWPAGLALIWLTTLGLAGFAAWRALQCILDVDEHGHSAKGWATRAGQAVSGVAHAILAWSLTSLMDGLDDLHEADDRDQAQAAAAAILAMPHGDLMLITAGAVVMAFGAGSMMQGLFQDFAKRLGCSPRTCRVAVILARTGYVGRGLAFAPTGFFLAQAGFTARATNAHDFASALQILEAKPFGSAVLAVAAAGLLAFGLFAFFEAGFRRIDLTSHKTGPQA